jgi:hypothetical protein
MMQRRLTPSRKLPGGLVHPLKYFAISPADVETKKTTMIASSFQRCLIRESIVRKLTGLFTGLMVAPFEFAMNLPSPFSAVMAVITIPR